VDFNNARKILTEHREKLDVMAAALIKYETIDEEQLADIMAGRVPRVPRDWDESGTSSSGQGTAKPEPVIGPPASQT
jgi:cell division protease FtsH